MNTPGKSPKVEDLTIKFKKRGLTHKDTAYGPYNAKVLRNYRRRGMGGFCTQRKGSVTPSSDPAPLIADFLSRYVRLLCLGKVCGEANRPVCIETNPMQSSN
jgi:hypothetical protein